MIPQSFITDLLNRVDVVEIVGRHVTLKKAGANFQGLCPFHNEKSPSFSVSPTKQFYHCFGCGAHGSAISFLMEYSGLTYVEAIEDLARSIGLTVPKEERRPADVQKQKQALAMGEMMERAANYYRQELKQSQRAIDYLKGRGLSGEIAKRYSLGYAPDAWQSLEAVFGSYQQDELAKVLIEAGMVIQSESKRYDRFRDRVMFPIRNTKGQVIAFGGRIIDAGEPKYLNSPETPLFSKGHTLYGLFEGRLGIRDKGYVIVCEGYMDVVALAQLGFPNAVATLGTACTSHHVRSLMRQADRIVFSFDGDAAGRRAAKRALEATLPMMADDKAVSFLFLPTEHDPDSYVRAYGQEAFEAAIRSAMPLSEYLIEVAAEEQDLKTPEGRAQTQFHAKPLIAAMPAIALRSQILHELARRLVISVPELESFMGLKTAQKVTESVKPAPEKKEKAASQSVDLAQQIVKLLMLYPALGKRIDQSQKQLILWVAEKRSVKAHELMQDLLSQCEQMPPNVGFAVFQEQLDQSAHAKTYAVLRERLMSTELSYEYAQEDFFGMLKKLELQSYKEEMTAIAQRMAEGKALPGDPEKYRELMAKLK